MQTVKFVVEAVPSDTVVVVVSDHGHLNAGGYGGASDETLDLPFWIYKVRFSHSATIILFENAQ